MAIPMPRDTVRALQHLVGRCPIYWTRGLLWRLEDTCAVGAKVDVHAGEAGVWVPERSLGSISGRGGRSREGIAKHVTLGRHKVVAHAPLLSRGHELRLLAKVLVILHGAGGVELGRKLTLTLAG
jgi:hypothetical protein